jgi:selenocysteine lyase/cysteine desulfurase
VLLCVDGVHGFGAVDAGPAELGCDFLVSGTHKWLFGPRGTGIVWGRREAWPAVRATIPAFEGATFTGWINDTPPVGLQPGPGATPGGYHSFEHRWALKEAFDFHQRIGRAAVAARITELATRLKDGLAEIDGLQLITPRDPELSAGVVCVNVDGRQPFEFLGQLRAQKIIASTTPYNPAYLRFGTSMAVLEDDVDELVKAMTELA